MGKWKRPFRDVLRWFRLHAPGADKIHIPAFMKIMSGNAVLGLILSIIPGLAHCIEGRFHEVRWFVLGWLLALLVGIFFYGGSIGFLLLGVAAALHGWIALSHKLYKEHDEIPKKLFDFGALLLIFGLLYWGVRRTVFRDFDFSYATFLVPYQNIQQGDVLLTRRSRAEADSLTRGSLVVVQLREVGGDNFVWAREGEAVVQIVGLGGERVGIKNYSFSVNGRVLDSEQFPVPQWLRERTIETVDVPDNSYFMNAVYNVYGRRAVDARLVGNACLIRESAIEAKVVMRWLPLTRRGFLRPNE
jgi:hypothetical protein